MANHEVKYPREFEDAVRMFETTDRGHADVFNDPVGKLVNNDAYLKEQVEGAKLDLQEHTESDIHVTEDQKDTWDNKVDKNELNKALDDIKIQFERLKQLEVEVKIIKDATLNNITNNIFMETFTELNNIKLSKGIYNETEKKIYI